MFYVLIGLVSGLKVCHTIKGFASSCQLQPDGSCASKPQRRWAQLSEPPRKACLLCTVKRQAAMMGTAKLTGAPSLWDKIEVLLNCGIHALLVCLLILAELQCRSLSLMMMAVPALTGRHLASLACSSAAHTLACKQPFSAGTSDRSCLLLSSGNVEVMDTPARKHWKRTIQYKAQHD